MTLPRILFAGTPEISVPLLKALAQRFEVAGVLTSCDKSSGRSGKPVPSPVKSAALELGLPVLQFDSIRTEAREAVKKLGADTLVSFAFGRIFGPRFLELFPNGKFNVHPSDLPAFRGPAPIQFTILEGLRQATVSLQSLGLKMDEGDIWGKTAIDLDGTETTQSLSETADEEKASALPELGNKLKTAFDKLMTALNTPWGRIVAGVGGLIFLVLVIVLFVNDNAALNRANQGLEQARTEMRDKHFINAKSSLERTKEGITGQRMTVLAFRKGAMVDRINEVLNSEELKEGVIREERLQSLENEIIETVMRAGLRLDERIASEVTWMRQNVTPALVDAQRAFETGRKQDVARIYEQVVEQRRNLPQDMQTALQKFWVQKERALNLVIPGPESAGESGTAGTPAGQTGGN